MSKGKSHGVPKAPPKRPISRRLEDVRTHFQVQSLRKFHRQLAESWPKHESVSYEAVRNYHYDRDAPASYLARVSSVFGVNLRWLVTGEGEMFEQRPQEEVKREILVGNPELDQLTFGQQEILVDVVVALWFQSPDRADPHEFPDQIDRQLVELAGDVALLLFLPLRWWGFRGSGDPRGGVPQAYFSLMLSALAEAVLPAGHGDKFSERPTPLMAKLQTAVGEEPDLTGARQFLFDDMQPAEQQRWAEAIIATRERRHGRSDQD